MINKKIYCLLLALLSQSLSHAMDTNTKPLSSRTEEHKLDVNAKLSIPKNTGNELDVNASTHVTRKKKNNWVGQVTKQAIDWLCGTYQERSTKYNIDCIEFKTYGDMKKFVLDWFQRVLIRNNIKFDNNIKQICSAAAKDLEKFYKNIDSLTPIDSLKPYELCNFALSYANYSVTFYNYYNYNDKNIWKEFNVTALNNSDSNICAILGLEKRVFDYSTLVKCLGEENASLLGGMRFVVAFTKKGDFKFYLFPDHYCSTAIELICYEK